MAVRSAVAWKVVESLGRGRDTEAIDAALQLVCPRCEPSLMKNAVFKNLGHLVHMGKHLIDFDIPSNSKLGGASGNARRKKRKKEKHAALQGPASAADDESDACSPCFLDYDWCERTQAWRLVVLEAGIRSLISVSGLPEVADLPD